VYAGAGWRLRPAGKAALLGYLGGVGLIAGPSPSGAATTLDPWRGCHALGEV
jgi:hypothetical protein